MQPPFVPPPGDAAGDRAAHLFLRSLTVMDIAEPLASFDGGTPADEVCALLGRRGWERAGVREEGLVTGYVERGDLSGGTVGDHVRPFGPDDLVASSASLAETIASLDANGRCFVSVLGRVGAIVTFRDLEKPPVRMWLFGMITIVETFMTRRIRVRYPEGSWTPLLSPARLAKAGELRAERLRRGQDADLLECVQLADKAIIFVKTPGAVEAFGFPSRRQAEEAFQRLQALRNALAHVQREIVSRDFQLVARLAASVERILRLG